MGTSNCNIIVHSIGYITFIFIFTVYIIEHSFGNDSVDESGQQLKFGHAGPQHIIDEVQGFPNGEIFFNQYVTKSKPLKMSGAVEQYRAFLLWDDDYFLSLEIPADDMVLVETRKKEDRKQDTLGMHFKDFVRSYNHSEYYMVQSVPEFLRKDVIVPLPLQCDQILEEKLMDGIMWFSSGGTKSVIHTDDLENINCVLRGQKQFILVNPKLYGEKLLMDQDGAYSGIDVDRVDFEQYPDLKDVEYEVANLTAGDCLYIPFKWIHQVRSFERNIAINFWYGSSPSQMIDLSTCNTAVDPDITMDKVTFQGLGKLHDSVEVMRDFLSGLSMQNPVTFDAFLKALLDEDTEILDEIDAGKGYQNPLKKVFSRVDGNRNGVIENEEVKNINENDWVFVQEHMQRFDDIVDFLLNEMDKRQHEREEL